jgi:hypothetical protein
MRRSGARIGQGFWDSRFTGADELRRRTAADSAAPAVEIRQPGGGVRGGGWGRRERGSGGFIGAQRDVEGGREGVGEVEVAGASWPRRAGRRLGVGDDADEWVPGVSEREGLG